MIAIPRLLLRQFRLALKRSFPPRCRHEKELWVVVEADKDQVTIRAQHSDAGIRVQLPAQQAPAVIVLPAQALDEAQGREGSVMLERQGDKVIARWDESGMPCVMEYDTTDRAKLPSFPESSTGFTTNPPELLRALDHAMHCAAVDSVRYATCKVQLRGSGEIVGTDGKQLLLQGGFQFPWKDSVLVPRMSLFGAGVLPGDAPVKIGRSGKDVFLQVGAWSIVIAGDTEGRFPKVEEVIPKGSSTTWTLSPADMAAVLQALPRMPGAKDENAPVTVELNGKVVVRAQGDQSRPVELHLEQAQVGGAPVRFSTNRNVLARALQLGFHEIRIVNADTPLVCREPQRLFVWMPLPKESCIEAHPEAIVLRSANINPPPAIKPERRKPAPRQRSSAKPLAVAPVEPVPAKSTGLVSLIEEARDLSAAMRGMFARSRNLLSALQLHRRKTRIVDSTLASLKKLQGKVP